MDSEPSLWLPQRYNIWVPGGQFQNPLAVFSSCQLPGILVSPSNFSTACNLGYGRECRNSAELPPPSLPSGPQPGAGSAGFPPRFCTTPRPGRPPCLPRSWVSVCLCLQGSSLLQGGTRRADGKQGICIPLPGAVQILPAILLTNPYQRCPWRSLW